MSNSVENAEYSSSDEEEEESGSEEEEQPEVVKARVDAKVLERKQQPEEESSEEEEEDSETDNHLERYNVVRNSAGAAVAANFNNAVGKRGRYVEGKDEEPSSKRSNAANVEKGCAVEKPAPPTKPTRGEPAGKRSKVAAAKSKPKRTKKVREFPEASASAAGRKRRAPSLPGNGTGKQKSKKVDPADKGSQRRTNFTWTPNLETAVSSALHHEKAKGKSVPSLRDPYWAKLVKDLNSGGDILTETQLYEKVRRMKKKYNQLKAKKVDEPWRNKHEEKLYRFWDGIWGSGNYAVRPESTQCVTEDSEEESSDDEEIVAPAVANGSKVVLPPTSEEESSESEEEEDEEPKAAPNKRGTRSEGSLKEVERSSFDPKSRLEFTPSLPKVGKKGARKNDGSTAERSGAELPRAENDRDAQIISAANNFVINLKEECFAVLGEIRTSCLDAVGDLRKQSIAISNELKVHFGLNAPPSGMWSVNEPSIFPLDRGMMEKLLIRAARSGLIGVEGAMTEKMREKWLELGFREIDLSEKRMQLCVKELRLSRKRRQANRQD